MNLPIMDETEHTGAPNEDSSAAPSTTIDRVQQLLALPVGVDVMIDQTDSSTSATRIGKSAALLQDEYLWGGWHLNGDSLVVEVLRPPGGIRVHCDYKEAPHGGIRANGQTIFPPGVIGDGLHWEWNGHELLIMQRCHVPCAHCKSEVRYFLFMDGLEVNSKQAIDEFWWGTYFRVFLIGLLVPVPFIVILGTIMALTVLTSVISRVPSSVFYGPPLIMLLGVYWVVRGLIGLVRHGKRLYPRRFPVCWLAEDQH